MKKIKKFFKNKDVKLTLQKMWIGLKYTFIFAFIGASILALSGEYILTKPSSLIGWMKEIIDMALWGFFIFGFFFSLPLTLMFAYPLRHWPERQIRNIIAIPLFILLICLLLISY